MSLSSADVDFLRSLVATESGNMITERQNYLFEQRLTPIAITRGLDGVDQLVARLRHSYDPQLSVEVAEAVTVNETSFFRDVHLFDAMRSTILPDLIKQNRDKKELRIWSAACSTGQEPYSLAILIKDSFPELSTWNVQILATDISERVLERSRQGEYTETETKRGLPTNKLERFFEPSGDYWRVRQELRAMIEHRRINLTQPWPTLGQFDIVLIRNVLIYFEQDTKSEILTRVRRAITPTGYLFIGSAETTIGLSVPYERQVLGGTICLRPTTTG